MPRANRRLVAAVFLGQLVPFLIVARYRLIDGDEGFYLMASRLVSEDRTPYRDFFFTQMPLTPYLYGLWMQVAGSSWIAARALSAILAAILGTLIFSLVAAHTKKASSGLFAAFLFVSSTLVFGWFTIAKTFAVSGLFLFLAFALIRSNVLASGVFLALAVDARLYLAGVLPLFLWWVYRDRNQTVRLLAGFGLGVLPNLIFLLWDADAYLFGNLLFHSIRSESGIVGNLPQKLYLMTQLFFGGGAGNGLQWSLLVGSLVCLQAARKLGDTVSRRAVELAALLSVISLLPTPSYVQYFCLCVPFLIVAAVSSGSRTLQEMKSTRAKRLAAVATAALALLYTAASAGDLGRFTRTGDGLNGIRSRTLAPNWSVDAVRSVSRAIDQFAGPGESVLSLWPGYIFESKAAPFPGLENNTGRERVDALRPGDAARYHILPQDEIERQIADLKPRLVVIGNQESMFVEASPYLEMLNRSGYRVVATVLGSSIWLAPPSRSRTSADNYCFLKNTPSRLSRTSVGPTSYAYATTRDVFPFALSSSTFPFRR
jgi:hypothetical protein